MRSSILLTCCYEEHENSPIIGVCTNQNCKHKRAFCVACKPQFHKEHSDDLIRFNEFDSWVKSRRQLIEPMNQLVNECQSFQKALKCLVGNLDQNNQPDFESMSCSEIEVYINQLILLEKSQVNLIPKIKSLINFQEKLKKEIESLILNKELCQNQQLSIEELEYQNQLNSTYLIKDDDIKIEEQKEIDKCVKIHFRFSQELKYEEITLTNNQSIAQGDLFALCEPVLPLNVSTKFAFKCHEDGIYIGVCRKELIKIANFNPKLNKLGHGAYLIFCDGSVYSHLEKEKNYTKQSFKYGKNDIIQVIVNINEQKITWIKQSTNEEYSMKLEVADDLCPCVQLWGKPGTQVEIIDF
ncbi:unnamed protein product [Paramecium primaurelia]|uniref:SPRY domain-containing protein n=1 Tax=Paramecium primaurelia TaxID=5886 RepID=A0A8S1N161_PARPR|nr:unnamed protein product [Paramecium primaurelia]